MNVEFVDELPGSRAHGRSNVSALIDFADALRANPGRWAKHPTTFGNESTARNTSSVIRRDRSATFPAKEFDAETRNGQVYVRYVGDGA